MSHAAMASLAGFALARAVLDFIGGGFQMVALKVGSYAFPREQSAMMSPYRVRLVVPGELHPAAGDRSAIEPDGQPAVGSDSLRIIALLPAVGIAVWLVLSRNQTTVARA